MQLQLAAVVMMYLIPPCHQINPSCDTVTSRAPAQLDTVSGPASARSIPRPSPASIRGTLHLRPPGRLHPSSLLLQFSLPLAFSLQSVACLSLIHFLRFPASLFAPSSPGGLRSFLTFPLPCQSLPCSFLALPMQSPPS